MKEILIIYISHFSIFEKFHHVFMIMNVELFCYLKRKNQQNKYYLSINDIVKR